MNYYKQICWVDEYIVSVSPYLYVREDDSLLIKIPNEAHKLNSQGIRVLKYLLSGESIYSIIDAYPDKESVSRDMHYFFCDLKALLKGCVRETDKRRAVENVPFSLPFNTLPVLSEIAVTYQCNLACRFCYAACGCTKKGYGKELSTGALKEILTIIRYEAEVPSVSFTGGEPVLRPDLVEMVGFAKSQNMWVNLITNGTLVSKGLAQALKNAGLDSAQVSLEAGNATLHDEIVRNGGAFRKTLAGLRNLRDAGIRVHTNTTISALNKDCLREIVTLVKNEGFDKFSMNLLMPEGAALDSLNNILVRYSDIGAIILDVDEFAKDSGLEFMWYSPTPMCIFNPVPHGLGNKGCAACDGLLSVDPNGDILPCSSYPKPMGNIFEMKGRFKHMWRSPQFVYFQQKRFAHKVCQSCDDLAICNGGCPLYWNQVGYGEILSMGKTPEALV